jgi:hypothetical protein
MSLDLISFVFDVVVERASRFSASRAASSQAGHTDHQPDHDHFYISLVECQKHSFDPSREAVLQPDIRDIAEYLRTGAYFCSESELPCNNIPNSELYEP